MPDSPAPAPPVRIICVCTANICRSPFAHLLLQHRLTAAGVEAEVTSGGTQAMTGYGMDARSREALESRGLAGIPELDTFRASPLTAERIAAADLVLTATVEHRDRALRLLPRGLKRTFTLREFAAAAPLVTASSVSELVSGAARRRGEVQTPLDIADPVTSDDVTYRAVMAEIDEAVGAITYAMVPR